jgi:hypothetical protein
MKACVRYAPHPAAEWPQSADACTQLPASVPASQDLGVVAHIAPTPTDPVLTVATSPLTPPRYLEVPLTLTLPLPWLPPAGRGVSAARAASTSAAVQL